MKAQHSLHGEALPSPYFNNLTIDKPLYLRLPKSGKRCPATGLSRSTLNDLILPTPSNDFRPPVPGANGVGPSFVIFCQITRLPAGR